MLNSSTKFLSQFMMALTILGLGAVSVYSFVAAEKKQMMKLYADNETKILNPHSELQARKLASVETGNPVKITKAVVDDGEEKLHGHAETLSLDCLRKGTLRIQTKASHLRLKGQLCENSQKLSQVVGLNRSNGFKASTFVLPKNAFTSDYIYLREGSNEVLLTLESQSGVRTVSQLQILRE